MKMVGKMYRIRIKTLILIILTSVILIPSISFAEKSIKIYSSVDEKQIGLDQTLILSVTVETKNISKILDPILPNISSFEILDRSKSTSTEISFINGKSSRIKRHVYHYTLKPKKIGKFIIGPIIVNYKGIQYKTDPIEITVTEKSSNNNNYITDEGLKIDPSQIKKDIFIKSSLSNKKVFVGEQIYLKYEIFSAYDIEQISLISMPDIRGFYKVNIENTTKLTYKTVLIKGKHYKYSALKRIVLFPLFAGDFKISPLKLKVTALIRSKEFPNFFALPYTLIISSDEINIDVKPLPPYTGKDKFSGIVGSLTINTAQYSKMIHVGESSKFYITVQSNGNLNNIKNFQFNTNLKSKIILSDIYNDKKLANNIYYFSKKFEYTIIPEEKGNLLINLNGLTYFNSNKNRYILQNIKPLSFNVKTASSLNNINLKNETLNKSSSDTSLLNKQIDSKYKNLLFVLIIIFLIITVIFLFFRLKQKRSQNYISSKSKTENEKYDLSRNIKLLMAEAESKFLKSDIPGALSLLKKVLIIALSNKTGIPSGKITIKTIKNAYLDQDLKNEISTILNFFNETTYSQKKEYIIDKKTINTYFDKVRDLIKRLEVYNFNQET